jgi:short-subunit dehydrogenase
MELDGKVVVLTGATAGVGYATALAFARARARLFIVSRDSARVRQTVATLREWTEAAGTAVDVADAAAVDRLADEAETALGPIDVWVNNAMTTVFSPFAAMTCPEFAQVTANTYFGTVWGTHAALKRMLPRDTGVIVQVGSALAYQAIPLQSAYCGAKHGIRGFTNAVRCELKYQKSAVRITMVQLSAFNTPQFDWARSHLQRNPRPLAPVFSPDLAAQAVVYAARRPRAEYWVGWPAMKTIIGSRLLPRVADWLASRQAYEGQMSDEQVGPRDGNLMRPVARDAGAAGRFGAESKRRSWQWWMTTHRAVAYATAALILAGLIGFVIA